ncbi:hypothetical protein [Streptomyces sp. NPDC101150]|uniref:hypothetical protein n=1 Tax=Streptomyces sp. NPDC101150 TaxID=3366114 RepID=UPI003827717C
MPLPPPLKCPTPDCDDWLWKDTTTTDKDWDNWRWWCHRCNKKWYPTAKQLGEFRHGSSSGASPGSSRGASYGSSHGPSHGTSRGPSSYNRDPRVPRR